MEWIRFVDAEYGDGSVDDIGLPRWVVWIIACKDMIVSTILFQISCGEPLTLMGEGLSFHFNP